MGTSHQSFYFNQDSHLHIMPNMLQVSYTTTGYGYDNGHFAAQWSIPILTTFNPLGPELNAHSDLKKATLQMVVVESSYNIQHYGHDLVLYTYNIQGQNVKWMKQSKRNSVVAANHYLHMCAGARMRARMCMHTRGWGA
jgi:hypothetical protein